MGYFIPRDMTSNECGVTCTIVLQLYDKNTTGNKKENPLKKIPAQPALYPSKTKELKRSSKQTKNPAVQKIF